MQNNRILNIKKMQVEQSREKVKEDEIKKYPTLFTALNILVQCEYE
jgi:hypothetical protein